MNVGDSQTFNYTGGMQSFVVPNKGIYKLEVWGSTSGGKGGYSKGYKFFEKGTSLYICCGGYGTNTSGYNGGGAGYYDGLSGGGATHIALVSGTLAGIGKTSFVTNGKGLIVAGGGGGGWAGIASGYGGTGGGTTGGSFDATGGTQSSGGIGNPEGIHESGGDGSFGKGANGGRTGRYQSKDWSCGGGGGGFYGGGAYYTNAYGAGAGGSGWIGGVPSFTEKGVTYSPSTSNGVWSSKGKATITLMKKSSTIKLGSTDCEVYLGDTQIDEIKLGNIDIG